MLTLFTKFGFVVAALWWALSPAMAQERRVALVIGNAAYKSVSTLQNPVNDSRAMAKSLRTLGFEVIERENASREGLAMAYVSMATNCAGHLSGCFILLGTACRLKGATI